jgi:hypothetical protein
MVAGRAYRPEITANLTSNRGIVIAFGIVKFLPIAV